VKRPSDEAKRRYAEYIKGYKAAIDVVLEREKKLKEVIASGPVGASYQRLTLAEENLGLVASYLLMNSLSWSFLGAKNEAYLNEARKCVYKTLIYLEEIVTPYIDVPFSDYEGGLASIESFADEARYNLVRKLGFSIDSLEDSYGMSSKWKWSFVEMEGRYAVVTKNLINLKTFVTGMDPRVEGYSSRLSHLNLAKELLSQAADRYREKYELSTMRIDDIKIGVNLLSALRRLHAVLAENEKADSVKKKAEVWRAKMEADMKKAETTPPAKK
jgi:hypothetical protein